MPFPAAPTVQITIEKMAANWAFRVVASPSTCGPQKLHSSLKLPSSQASTRGEGRREWRGFALRNPLEDNADPGSPVEADVVVLASLVRDSYEGLL